jgi:hypothetical protein
MLIPGFLFWLILRLWRWSRYVLPKIRLTFTGLRGVKSQNRELVFKIRFNIILTSIARSRIYGMKWWRGIKGNFWIKLSFKIWSFFSRSQILFLSSRQENKRSATKNRRKEGTQKFKNKSWNLIWKEYIVHGYWKPIFPCRYTYNWITQWKVNKWYLYG